MSGLLPVEEARDRLLALGDPVEVEEIPVDLAAGRWLAADIAAGRTQPSASLSAMDGYAIRFSDLPGPWRVTGESAAGRPLDAAIGAGEAARIFTGAALPAGADTILVQEEAGRDGDQLRLAGEGPPRRGAHVRAAGEDFAQGQTLLAAGLRLTPARIGLAVAAGHGSLPVRRRVRLALISTGDELRPPGEPLGPGGIPASNGPMLAAMLGRLPIDLDDRGIVGDDLAMLRRTIAETAEAADIVVTIGGASVGDHDLVRAALKEAGATIDFWRIAMKPGKPLMAGRLDEAVILGLPGNPVSAFVTAQLFLLPLVARLSGAAEPGPHFETAALAAPLAAGGPRAEYLRGRRIDGRVEPLPVQSSAVLSALAAADSLIERPCGAPPAQAGDRVRILPIA